MNKKEFKTLRKQLTLSADQMGKLCRVSGDVILNYENGRTEIPYWISILAIQTRAAMFRSAKTREGFQNFMKFLNERIEVSEKEDGAVCIYRIIQYGRN